MKKTIVPVAILFLLLLAVTHADAADVTFTASLKSFGSSPVYVNLVLTNCGQDAQGRSNIPMTSAGVKAKLNYILSPDATGIASATDVTPNADITCGNVPGATRYRVEIRLREKNVPDPQHDPLISANEFVIGPGNFTLSSAQSAVSPAPTTSAIDFSLYKVTRPFRVLPLASFPAACVANKDRIQRSDPDVAGCVDYVCNGTGDGWQVACGGGGGSPVKVNNSQVLSPNFNDTAPAAGTGFINCKWNVNSSNIALECPFGTSSSSFAVGNDSRIVNAVPNTRSVSAGAGLSGGGSLSADRTISANVGTTPGTLAAGDDSRIVGAVPNSRSVAAGTGLTGGGNLTADRTISANIGTTPGSVAAGDDSRIVSAVPNSRQVAAGTGLSGGGDLSADRSLSVNYGIVAGTAAQGNDSRVVNALQPGAALSNLRTAVTLAGNPYGITSFDYGHVVVFNNNSVPQVVTLPNPGAGNAGQFVWVSNIGSFVMFLQRTGGQTWTIDGASSLLIYQYESVLVVSDGSNWYTARGKSGNGDPAQISFLGPTISMSEWDQTLCNDGEIPKKAAGAWGCGTDASSSSGGSAVNVNGATVDTPNFNVSTPAAEAGYINAKFQNTGSNVSVEIQTGNTSSTVAPGNHLHTGVYEPANLNIQSHIVSTANPHSTTKGQVGLGNADNTSDLNKPVSTAQQAALNLKADDSGVVHKSGDESIAGVKQLTDGLKLGAGIANNTSTGTANKLLAKFDSSGRLVKAGTTDTAVPVAIVNSGGGTSGTAFICSIGQCTCTFDGSATAQHYVIASTSTAGTCHDAGATLPVDVWIVGQVNATIASAGDGVVNVLPGFLKSSGGSSGCSSGTPNKLDPGSSGQCEYDSTYFYMYVSTSWNRTAWDSGWSASQVSTPTHSPDTSTVANDISGVTIATSTSGAALKYCLDNAGSCDPTTGTTYSTAVAVAPSGATARHLRSIGQKAGLLDSSVKDSTYTFTAATPTDSPGAGTYGSSQSVTLATSTTGASILYTTDGSTPSCPSTGTTYSGAITVSATTTVKAIACKSSYNASGVLSSTYTISGGGGITLIQHGSASATSTSVAKAFGSNVTTGSCLVATVFWYDNSLNISGVSGSTNGAYTQIVKAGPNGAGFNCAIYRKANATAGSENVTASFGGSSPTSGESIHIAEYSGLSSGCTDDGHNGQSSDTTGAQQNPTSGNFTTTASGDLIVGGVLKSGNQPTGANGLTDTDITTQSWYEVSGKRVAGAAGTDNAAWSSSGANIYVSCGAGLK